MRDDKRLLRQIKREVKRLGTRKLRRFLKDVEAEPDDFDYGRHASQVMNEPRTKNHGVGQNNGVAENSGVD